MASSGNKKEGYADALLRQKNSFQQKFGCGMSPTFYFIHYDDGSAHWSTLQWGWDIRYLNLEKGDETPCGELLGWGVGLCKKCRNEKGNEIQKMCREFEQELKRNHQDEMDKEIAEGRKIRVITRS